MKFLLNLIYSKNPKKLLKINPLMKILKSILKIDVNYKQVGSDRLANAISVSSKNKNFVILDFGTATTFDVLIGKNMNDKSQVKELNEIKDDDLILDIGPKTFK